MRRAFIHVGLPRTGTTSVQRVLSRLRPELLRQGVLYPELTPRSAAEPHLSHQHLGEALDGRRGRRDRDELLARLAEQLREPSADTAILSYEGLCLPRGGGAARLLAGVFEAHGWRPTPIMTVKPQHALINSAYTWRTQFLREARGFAEYRRAALGGRRLDFAAVAAPWRRACEGRLLAVPVEDARCGRPLIERLMEQIGALDRARPLLAPGELTLRDNRSPGPVAVEVARRLRAAGSRASSDVSAREVTRFVEGFARDRGWDKEPFNGVDAAMRAEDEARFAAANDRFAEAVWGAPWPPCAAGAGGLAANEIARAGAAPSPEVEAALGEARARFDLAPRRGLLAAWRAVRTGRD